MKVPWFIFIVLAAMCVTVGAAFIAPQVPFEDVVKEDGSTERIIKSHGYPHATYPTMRHGGPGAERHAVTLWIGWGFAVLSVLFFSGCLLLGISRDGKLGPAKTPFIVGTIAFAAIFTGLIFSYYTYMHEDTHVLFLSFPRPTAWMLFGVWPFPIYFVAVYYFLFDRWHYTEQDEKRLEEILAARRQSTAEGP